MVNRYIKILDYCDKNFLYFYAALLPWLTDLFFPNFLNLFTYDYGWFPTSIIGKIYVLGYVYPFLYLITFPLLIRSFSRGLRVILKKLFNSNLALMQFITAIILIIAIFPIRAMGYYTFLRIFVFTTAIATIFFNYAESEKNDSAMIGLVISIPIAVLFNPLFPIYLWEKTSWIWIDFMSALFFLMLSLRKS